MNINLNINQINNIYSIGKQQTNRPLIVEFISFFTKIEVLKNCKKLKGTKISITDDLTKNDQVIRQILLKHQKQAKQYNLNAYIRGNKLIINDDTYTVEQLENGNEIYLPSQEHHIVEELVSKKISSAPTTPSNFQIEETDDDTYETLEEKEQEDDEIDHIKVVKKRKINKQTHHKYRPLTRNLCKELEPPSSSKNKNKNVNKKSPKK